MEYKETTKKLISEIEEMFSSNSDYQKWSEEKQEILNEKLGIIAEDIGVFDSTGKNEEDNIRHDLTVIDKSTGETIDLVNITNMREKIKKVLKTNDMFSILRAVAVSNKCAHKCDNNYEGLQEQIKRVREDKKKFISSKMCSFDYSIESLSKSDFENLMEALDKKNIKRGAIISICRSLGIDIEEIKSNEGELNKIFCELKDQRGVILENYEEHLLKKAETEQRSRESLFWIKDQLIAMIGQLLVTNEEYRKLNYEMVECGQEGFNNMLAIDYEELSYYIEVHMPNFIADELVQKYNLKAPVKSEERTFERLGASAVYDRDNEEMERVRAEPLTNARRRIIARPKRNMKTSQTYKFVTKKIQNKENVGILEKVLRAEEDSKQKQMQYSKIRSDEKQTDIEARIIADSLDEVFRERDDLDKKSAKRKENFVNKIKFAALQEAKDGDAFDKFYLIHASRKTENEIIRLIAYEREISNMYKAQKGDYNIVQMLEFIQREVPKLEKRVEQYRTYKEKNREGAGRNFDGR